MPPIKSKRVSYQKVLFPLFLVVLIALSFCNILKFISTPNKIILKDTTKTDEVFWEKVKANNPTYRDAYLVLASIKASQGDGVSAAELIEAAKKIDPYTPNIGL
jgi:hypothetical protein